MYHIIDFRVKKTVKTFDILIPIACIRTFVILCNMQRSIRKRRKKMKNKKISSMLLVLVLAFMLVPGVSASPTYGTACQNCHTTGGTLSITNIAIASTTVNQGQVFNADVTWTGGSSGSTTVKWPSVVVNNNLFTFTPVQRDYTVTSGTSSFAITAPSTPGTYTIRVYAVTGPNIMESGYRDITIIVQAPQPKVLTTVTISPTNPTVVAGNTRQFSAATLDQNGASIGAVVTWSSSNTAAGTINANGLFTAAGAGTATITVTAVNGSVTKTNSTTVTVTAATQPKVLTTVTISPTNQTVVEGSTQQFSATPLDQNNAPIGASLTWASSDMANGTINNTTGLFTAVRQGTTTITVTAVNGSTTKINRTVVTVGAPGQGQELKNITVLPETATIVVGKSRTFIAITLDQFNKAISVIVTWASNNTSVGTIDSNGKFTALSEGTTTITATNGTINGSALVTVKSPNTKTNDDENEEHEYKDDKHQEIEHKVEKQGDKHEIEEDEFEED